MITLNGPNESLLSNIDIAKYRLSVKTSQKLKTNL